MTTPFNLSLTGGEIDTTLDKVANPDATPTTASTRMVTSSGIKSYVDTSISASVPSRNVAFKNLDSSGSCLCYDGTPKTFSTVNNNSDNNPVVDNSTVAASNSLYVSITPNFLASKFFISAVCNVGLLRQRQQVLFSVLYRVKDPSVTGMNQQSGTWTMVNPPATTADLTSANTALGHAGIASHTDFGRDINTATINQVLDLSTSNTYTIGEELEFVITAESYHSTFNSGNNTNNSKIFINRSETNTLNATVPDRGRTTSTLLVEELYT